MQIETEVQKIVQLLLKGDDYDTLCPKDEDTWYSYTEALAQPRLIALISKATLVALRAGLIDYVVCRGNW